MIKSFRHRGLEKFFEAGSKAGIQPKHADKLRVQLFALNNAKRPEDMNAPGWRLHRLAGQFKGHWAISVGGNWRLTFKFEGEDAILVDYHDLSLARGSHFWVTLSRPKQEQEECTIRRIRVWFCANTLEMFP